MALLLLPVTQLPVLAQSAPDPVGVFASGTAGGRMELGCTVCTNYPIVFSNAQDVTLAMAGGLGVASASLSRTAIIDRNATDAGFPQDPQTLGPDYTLGGGASFAASASLGGLLSSPLLGASARTDNVRVYRPWDTPTATNHIGWDYFDASATATAIQRYTFTGTRATTYRFEFTFDGTLFDSRATLTGEARAYDDNPELPLATAGAVADSAASQQAASFVEAVERSFFIDLSFQPGQSLTLEATLSAYASGFHDFNLPVDHGVVEAAGMNTMWVSAITGGDLNLLTPALAAAAVPEPGAWALWVAGLGALLLWRRPRRL